MDRYDYPDMYDYYFYQKKWFAIFKIIASLFMISMIGYVFYFKFSKLKLFDILLLPLLGFIFLCYLSHLIQSLWSYNKIIVGINKDGIFVQDAGMLYWDDIKSFTVIWNCYDRLSFKCIEIKTSLHYADAWPSRFSRFKRICSLTRAHPPNVIIRGTDVTIKLEKLLDIMNKYKKGEHG